MSQEQEVITATDHKQLAQKSEITELKFSSLC